MTDSRRSADRKAPTRKLSQKELEEQRREARLQEYEHKARTKLRSSDKFKRKLCVQARKLTKEIQAATEEELELGDNTTGSGVIRAAGSALLLLFLQGCCITPGFVATQRAFYDEVVPEYLTYVDNDPALTQDQKDRRHRLCEADDAAITEAEQSE